MNVDRCLFTDDDILGTNIYTYTSNNPIVRKDFVGEVWNNIVNAYQDAVSVFKSMAPVYAGKAKLNLVLMLTLLKPEEM